VLIVGEVDTGLLRGRDLSSGDDGRRLVDLVAGERVLVSTRPRAYVRSPQRPVGVDCDLGALRRTRGIGTVMQRAAITDGQVVQGSAYATLATADGSARRPWSHYLARPGVVEMIGRVRDEDLADAFASPARGEDALDLGAVARRITGEVQASARGASTEVLRAARSQVRWVARVDEGGADLADVRFNLHDRRLRLLRFTTSYASAPHLAAACEDVALHDWLLSTLIENVRKAAIGIESRPETLRRLRPVIDHILHLWMPAASGDEFAGELWGVLERHGGFSRQWEALCHRIRDQLSVGLATAALTAASPR
jgi:hypothetical protein